MHKWIEHESKADNICKILDSLHIFDFEVQQDNLFNIMLGFFTIWYYTLALMFLYRYAQTTRDQKLSQFLANIWSMIVHIVILTMLTSLIIIYGGHLFLNSRDTFIEAMKNYTMGYKSSSKEELYDKLYANAKEYKIEVMTFTGEKGRI